MRKDWIYFHDSDGDHLVELELPDEFWPDDQVPDDQVTGDGSAEDAASDV